MRNEFLEKFGMLIGHWDMMLSDAWFLEPRDTEVQGAATFEWIRDAFIGMRSQLGGAPSYDLMIGYSDARQSYIALYHDERGVSRVFNMTFDGATWNLWRDDPDFYQRFIADVGGDEIAGRWEASEDQGKTWRKDYDLTFRRTVER